MRKNLMDQVKDIYLSKQEHSTVDFSKKLANELDQSNEVNVVTSPHSKSIEKSLSKSKFGNELKQPEFSSNFNPQQQQQQQQQQLLLHQQRKMIKCPICTDENKYFVNISDHFIKIHHLNTSEMRKPYLKKIKDESKLSFFNFDSSQTNSYSCSFANASSSNEMLEKNSNQATEYLVNTSLGI